MRRLLALPALIALAACGTVGQADDIPPTMVPPTTVPPAAGATTTVTTAPPTTLSTTTSTTAPPTTAPPTAPPTTTTSTTTLPPPPAPLPMATLDAAVDALGRGNAAVSVSVWRDGSPVHQRAIGRRVDGNPATTATPFVQASVSKVLTALTVVRLAAAGRIDLDAAPPWTAMGLLHHPDWDTVTVRELMAHESGLPIAAELWFDKPGSCVTPLSTLLVDPPTARRGEWTYSNGNYCALGLLVEHVTGERFDAATRRLVLEPAAVTAGHLTVDGLWPDDAPYSLGVARLDRLGAAGQWVMSTDAVAAVLSSVTRRDLRDLEGPGLLRDMLGWGHTGTIDGAKSCAWVIDRGRVAVVATVAGNRPARGSLLCAEVIPAVISDLMSAGLIGHRQR